MFIVGLEFWIWEVLSGIWNVEIVWHGNCSDENGFCNWSCWGFLAPVLVLDFFLLLLWELDNQVPLAGGLEMRLTVFWSWSDYKTRWSRHWHLMSMPNRNIYHLQTYLLKEAYWRNGCCMNPTCAATRLSINCILMHCNLCFRFLILTKAVQDLLSENICTIVILRI